MEFLRHSKIISAIWLFLAFLILNYSIDVPDSYGDSVHEDLSFNDIESFTELVFEYGFHWDNFVPEHDDDDSDKGGGFAKKIEIVFVLKPIVIKQISPNIPHSTEHFFSYNISNPDTPYIPGEHKPPQA